MKTGMRRWTLAAATALAAAGVTTGGSGRAEAFCGFYINKTGGEMFNDATQVVLMRMGTRTVLSMQNNYKGPPSAFALVIPVPVVLQEADVKTLPAEVFKKIDQMGAPRLVEYWEQDPCQPDYEREASGGRGVAFSAAPMEADKASKDDLGVTVEAQFTVGEYEIVILSAKDSTGLETWLQQEKYQIPAGAEPLLRPYVSGGSKFFVAKVNPDKVTFADGRAQLSPLRFHYDHDDFSLPIRLGLANSSGTQDLIVNILAPGQRYEVGNRPNVTIPTNLDVKNDVRERFGEFYAALFDRTMEKNPGAVVTEYAWQATTCDPCPGPQLDYHDLATLGADVLAGERGKVSAYQGWDFVHTRMHARYGKDNADDLVFKQAAPIIGGREVWSGGWDDVNRTLEERSKPAGTNAFQGRYAIRHTWTGPIACDKPKRGRWGGPPDGVGGGVKPALDLAFAPRGQAKLEAFVAGDVPELAVKATSATAPVDPAGATPPPAPVVEPMGKRKSGCGCSSDAGGGRAVLAAALVLLVLGRRRRRQEAGRR